MPEPGPFGPLPWSYARPRSLQAFLVVFVVTFVYWTTFISYGGTSVVGWLPGFVVTYLAWRGSKTAWAVAVIGTGIYLVVSAIEVGMATTPGGHHPMLHVIESILVLTMLALLLMPTTRRFYDLEARQGSP